MTAAASKPTRTGKPTSKRLAAHPQLTRRRRTVGLGPRKRRALPQISVCSNRVYQESPEASQSSGLIFAEAGPFRTWPPSFASCGALLMQGRQSCFGGVETVPIQV